MIYQFFNAFKENKINYSVLNGYTDIFAQKNMDSDIDILFKRHDFLKIEEIIKPFCKKNNYKIVQIYHQEVWAKNIFVIDANSGQLLNLDIYGQLSRKGVLLFNEQEIFKNIETYKQIPILTNHQEFIYYLSKKLDKKDLSKESFIHLRELYLKSSKKCNKSLINYFSKTHGIISKAFCECVYKDIKDNNTLLFNDFASRKNVSFINFIKDKARILKRIIKPTGITICFLGSDGSGKSTIIDGVMSRRLPYRRTDYFHLKPIPQNKTIVQQVVENPHEFPPYSKTKSFIKLLYFIYQYNVGWLKNIMLLKIKSSLIIFDRYYDDILVDYKRYRYGGSLSVAKFIRNFIPKPDLYFILTTDPKVIYQRKQEVPFTELERQIREYNALADNKRYFQIDVNRSPEEITKEIINIMMQKMNERY